MKAVRPQFTSEQVGLAQSRIKPRTKPYMQATISTSHKSYGTVMVTCNMIINGNKPISVLSNIVPSGMKNCIAQSLTELPIW